ncbi:hypothetical protein [Pectinatus brassicae]|uniref:Uncharacterized protein n=1 Tax=Pectinatus brassicae TaxID=862415 RepID=A0A840UHN9_9FIRM|nr:hypothetical protein [Pectinatus brassicae]MBB5335057.1 hypothetical protein [Pectinatus brassicae]
MLEAKKQQLVEIAPPIVYEVVYYGGTAWMAPYGRPGTRELAQSVIEPLQKK